MRNPVQLPMRNPILLIPSDCNYHDNKDDSEIKPQFQQIQNGYLHKYISFLTQHKGCQNQNQRDVISPSVPLNIYTIRDAISPNLGRDAINYNQRDAPIREATTNMYKVKGATIILLVRDAINGKAPVNMYKPRDAITANLP